MMIIKIIFWWSLFITFYTFAGYGIVLYLIIKVKRLFLVKNICNTDPDNLPTLTLIVAAYNEAEIIEVKINDVLSLEYPNNKIKYIFVTDGSSDRTPEIVALYPDVQLMHSTERKGKIHAIHRAMKNVDTDIVVFTDANALINKNALINIARHYSDERVGAVSGEKRVRIGVLSDATAGEGFYWKYESALKKWDSELYSVVGAAGELFSIRTNLYEPVPLDTILDDFMISLSITSKGYKIVYEPDAYAVEESSANIHEELKRKVRISAGGIQSIIRLKSLMNPFKHPLLSFQFISHRVLRWTITPFLLPLVLITNIVIFSYEEERLLWGILIGLQIIFYSLAFLGWTFEKKEIRIRALFVPFYFCFMNVAVILGIIRFYRNKQNATWEKVKRRQLVRQ